MAVRGDQPLVIQPRAGPTDFATTQIYVRTAEAVRLGFDDVFPPMPAALPGGTRLNQPRASAMASSGLSPWR